METLKLTTHLLPSTERAKRGCLHIDGTGVLKVIDYDDEVACGVDLFLCSTLPINNGDYVEHGGLISKVIVAKENYLYLKNDLKISRESAKRIEFATDTKLHFKFTEQENLNGFEVDIPAIDVNTKGYITDCQFEVNFLEEYCKRYNQKDNHKEVDVEKLAAEWCEDKPFSGFAAHTKRAFIDGYNQALQSNAGGFSLEDMKEAIRMSRAMTISHDKKTSFFHNTSEEIIQSLTKSQPKGDIIIECEMEERVEEDTTKDYIVGKGQPCIIWNEIKLDSNGQPTLIFK